MKKLMFTFIALLAMAGMAYAQAGGLVYHEVQIVNESGKMARSITTVTVRLPATTDAATIYKDAARTLAITQPMTTATANTTLANGSFYWYGPDGWDYTIGDGTNSLTNYGHDSMTSSDSRIVFPSYIQAISSTSYTDEQSATFGSDSDFVLSGGSTADTLNLLSANQLEAAYFNIGEDEAGIDLKVFGTTSGDYWSWDASADLFTIVGDAVAWTLTEAASTAVNIDITGAAGGFDLDTTNGAVALTAGGASNGDMTLTAGDAFSVAATGEIDIDSSAGGVTISANAATKDININSVLGSIWVLGEEDIANAVLITADGGTSSTLKIHNDTGNVSTANAASIQLTSDLGAINLVATANVAVAEGASAIQLTASAGGIELLSNLAGDNAIKLTADGGATAEIDIYNDAGTTADSIGLLSDEGGITLTTTLGATAITGIGGHSITGTAVADGAYGLEVAGTIAGATKSEGAGAYIHSSITGNVDGPTYNLGSWMDITTGTPSAGPLAAIDCGIYADATTDLSAVWITGLQIQTMVNSATTPSAHYMMRFNTEKSGDLPDAWFFASNPESVAFSANATHTSASTDKIGAVAIAITGYGTCYFYVYDHAGQ